MKWHKWEYTVTYNGQELSGKFKSLNARNLKDARQVLEDNYGIGCVKYLQDVTGLS